MRIKKMNEIQNHEALIETSQFLNINPQLLSPEVIHG
jgi:hypothetical protein